MTAALGPLRAPSQSHRYSACTVIAPWKSRSGAHTQYSRRPNQAQGNTSERSHKRAEALVTSCHHFGSAETPRRSISAADDGPKTNAATHARQLERLHHRRWQRHRVLVGDRHTIRDPKASIEALEPFDSTIHDRPLLLCSRHRRLLVCHRTVCTFSASLSLTGHVL